MSGFLRACVVVAVCVLFGLFAGASIPEGAEGFHFFPLGMVPVALHQTRGGWRHLTAALTFGAVALALTAISCSPAAAVLYAAAALGGGQIALKVLRDEVMPLPLRTESDWLRLVLASAVGALMLTGAAAVATQADASPHAGPVILAAAVNGFASFLVWLPLATRNRVHPSLAGARERVLQWGLLLVMAAVAFSYDGPSYTYVVLGILVWGALRLSLAETLSQLIVVRMIATTHTASEMGPYAFSTSSVDLPPDLHPLHLQLFLVMCSMIVVAFSLSSSRTRAETRIEAVVEATEVAKDQISTVQEQLEDLRDRDRIRDQVISTVSHELRTPITNVIGYAEMLEDGDYGILSPPQLTAVGKIDDNSRRLLGLIDDLLLTSRVRAGQLDLSLGQVDLRDVVRGATDLVTPRATASGLNLRVALPSEPVLLVGDAEKLERALVNLAGNAVKFTPPAGTVALSLHADAGEAVLQVADTGQGISEDDLTHLFSQFFRTQSARDQHIQGTGLGLTIVQSIVEAHGGRVEVTSTLGAGTTFVVRLPLQGATPPAAAQIT